jgi:hypothetical protein
MVATSGHHVIGFCTNSVSVLSEVNKIHTAGKNPFTTTIKPAAQRSIGAVQKPMFN